MKRLQARRDARRLSRAPRRRAGCSRVLSGALGRAVGRWRFASLRMARRVVTPAVARWPTRASSRSTRRRRRSRWRRTPDTELPGRYGLFTSGTERLRQARVRAGARTPRASSASSSRRSARGPAARAGRGLQRLVLRPPGRAAPALHAPSSSAPPVGPCPAWLFPAGDADAGSSRCTAAARRAPSACARCRCSMRSASPSLVVSYRNDGEAPRSRAGTYALGATEWRDVDAAVGYARRRGARRVVLMGWSMGGRSRCRLELNSRAPRRASPGSSSSRRSSTGVTCSTTRRSSCASPAAVTGLAIGALAVRVGFADHRRRRSRSLRPARLRRAGRRAAASDPDPAQRRRRLRAVGRVARPRRGAARHRRTAGVRGRAAHQAVELRPGTLERQHPRLARATRPAPRRSGAVRPAASPRPDACARSSMPVMPRDAQRRDRSVSPMLCGKSSGIASTSSAVSPVMPCARMLAKPRVVGASRAVACIATDAVVVDLDEDEHRRLALLDALEQLGVVVVLAGHGGQLVRELQQQLKPVGLGELEELVADLGERCREGACAVIRSSSHAPSATRRSAGAPRPARRPSTIGTRTALPHSVHDPS